VNLLRKSWKINVRVYITMIFLLQKIGSDEPKPFAFFGTDCYYYDLAQSYLQRKLTFDADRLDAFIGILKAIEHYGGSKFLFSLPEDIIDHAPLWMPGGIDYPKSRSQVFPSWSWASWPRKIEFFV
jgi:hypothetical protein